MKPKGKLFVVSAPSGAGKTTLVTEALKTLQKDFSIERVVTCTSREPRGTEQNKIDYLFFSKKEFEEKINNNFFLEHTEYSGNCYGSPSSIFNDMEQGKSFILIIDLVGAKRIKQIATQATFIWIAPPSLKILEKRLRNRKTDNDIKITKRLEVALKEMSEEKYLSLFDYHITNDNLTDSINELTSIIKNGLIS
jgi:guanylate kinase